MTKNFDCDEQNDCCNLLPVGSRMTTIFYRQFFLDPLYSVLETLWGVLATLESAKTSGKY